MYFIFIYLWYLVYASMINIQDHFFVRQPTTMCDAYSIRSTVHTTCCCCRRSSWKWSCWFSSLDGTREGAKYACTYIRWDCNVPGRCEVERGRSVGWYTPMHAPPSALCGGMEAHREETPGEQHGLSPLRLCGFVFLLFSRSPLCYLLVLPGEQHGLPALRLCGVFLLFSRSPLCSLPLISLLALSSRRSGSIICLSLIHI